MVRVLAIGNERLLFKFPVELYERFKNWVSDLSTQFYTHGGYPVERDMLRKSHSPNGGFKCARTSITRPSLITVQQGYSG